MKKHLYFVFILTLTACAAPQTPPLPLGEGGVRETPPPTETLAPSPVPTETLAPTPEATANADAQYRETLNNEQQVLFDQSKDMTTEGFNRQFLTEQDLENYLAYYDNTGEVAFVWNFEQGKLNPALKIENNLLINETSGSHIIWNPKLNKAEAQKTLADYFTYARARVIAGAQSVQLGNTLDSALGNPLTQEFLDEGRNVVLLPTSRSYTNVDGSSARFKVPAQNIFVSGETPVVFRTVPELDENMVVISGTTDNKRWLKAYGFEQNAEGVLFINYYDNGADASLASSNDSDLILARRLSLSFALIFGRVERSNTIGAGDTITVNEIFNGVGLRPENPFVIYSQTR